MRPTWMLGGIAGVLLAGLAGQAQTPDVRTVVVREVLVRSGPSEKYQQTGRLAYGDRVTVVPQPAASQQAGWLAIVPPRGSYSWINQRFVQANQAGSGTGTVIADSPVPLLVGSSEVKEEPNKEAGKAQRGSQVVIVGQPNYTDKGVWLPILPQPGEVRYIPESAVQSMGGAPPLAANAPASRPAPGVPLVAPNPAAAAPAKNDEVAQNLQKAADAEKDPVARGQILQLLASRHSTTVTPAGYPNTVVAGAAPAGGNTALYAGTAASPYSTPPKWTDYGVLQRTAFSEADGRPVYRLEDDKGRILTYATPLPNLTLEPYVGRKLTLYGPSYYNQSIRLNEVMVSHVAPLTQNRY